MPTRDHSRIFRAASIDFPYGFPYCLCVPSKPGHVTLNFHPVLLERMRAYAKANELKLNAVLKRAFELLEDHPELVEKKGRFDY